MRAAKHYRQLLSIDFNIEALAFVPGPDGTRGRRIHVLGREVRDRPGLVEYLSPAFGSRVALDGYCKANFDAVLHLAYPCLLIRSGRLGRIRARYPGIRL
ncbi:hypothetical protein [Citrobacter portucalensis]|uniref:hypothetical protein n=1 Tax=Citrobacter portucalensis TaxID=1639133 RepID=UPI003BF495A2